MRNSIKPLEKKRKKKEFQYQPISLKDILREMKQKIDLMIDLAYSAIKFSSKEIADEATKIEKRIHELTFLLNLQITQTQIGGFKEAKRLEPIVVMGYSIDKMSDALADIARVVYINSDISEFTQLFWDEVPEPIVKINIKENVHTFYVKAEGTDGTTSNYASITFSIDTTFIDTDDDGWSDSDEQKYGTDPNNPDNYPLDTDGDGIPNSVDNDDDADGYSDDMEQSYGTNPLNLDDYPLDTDNDGVPDEDSPDEKYTGDIDDDDDNLIDTIETRLGSNPKDESDVKKIYITGEAYYLVDTSQNGIYDILYNPTSDTTTAVEKQGETYLIDKNGDAAWDYTYNIADGSISTHEKEQFIIWIFLFLTIIIFIISSIFLYYRRYQPRRVHKIPKRFKIPFEIPSIRKKHLEDYAGDQDTAVMINQTKILLQNIQHDVTRYMDKLSQIEDQIAITQLSKDKQITIPQEEEIVELDDTPDITKPELKETFSKDIETKIDEMLSDELEKKVDCLLSKLDKKDKNQIK